MGIAVKELPASTIVFGRVAMAALLLLVICRLFQTKFSWGARLWFSFLVMGLFNNVIPFLMVILWPKANFERARVHNKRYYALIYGLDHGSVSRGSS